MIRPALISLVMATQTVAQNNCAQRAAIVANLTEKYGEVFVGGGLKNPNEMVEIWASEKTGTFTALITYTNGVSCIVSSGQGWTFAKDNPDQGEKI